MLKNKLVIIPFGFSWNWPCDYERQTALYLARKNIVIAFLINEGVSLKNYLKGIFGKRQKVFLKKTGKNFFKFTPLFLIPFHRIGIIQKINYFLGVWQLRIFLLLNKNWRGKNKTLWFFTSQLAIQPRWFGQNFFSLYDCVDLATSLDKNEAREKKIQEKQIIRQVKAVFANSFSLYNLKKKLHSAVYFVPQGFSLNLFVKSKNLHLPPELAKIPSPRIGFIGNINYKLDFDLIKNLARLNPDYSFVFIGPLDPDPAQDKFVRTKEKLESLSRIKNIYFLGHKPKKQIPAYLKFLDFGFIPYDIYQEFNRFCYPMKLFEYFYMGKPVLSTLIEELKRFSKFVKIGRNAKEFKKHIDNILKSGWPEKYKKGQRKLAIANSWKAKIEKISRILKSDFKG